MTEHEVKWRGIAKLIEECGELTTILGKLMAYPNGNHPDGKGDLVMRLQDEIADVQGACLFFIENNGLCSSHIINRKMDKITLFREWTMAGVVREKEIE